MNAEWKEFEDLLYGLQQEVRGEMKHHFFRFVQLEQKFQELGQKLIDVQLELELKFGKTSKKSDANVATGEGGKE